MAEQWTSCAFRSNYGLFMCFSPQADLVGGAIVSGFGVDAIRHLRSRRNYLLLASIPLILGAHQVIESLVWWGLEGDVSHGIERVALWAYLLIAFVLLPVLIPVAIICIEPNLRRRVAMLPFTAIGTGVAVLLLAALIRGPFSVGIRPHHLDYFINQRHGLVIVGFYVVAVCGALLCSGDRHVVVFGLVNVVAIAVIAGLIADGFASVWCGWATVSSGAIAVHMRFAKPHRAHPYLLA